MSEKIGQKVWKDGTFIDWNDANIHIMSHVIHYGTSVFEGIRCYDTDKGPAVFRLREHMQRLLNSARIYRMEPDYTVDELCDAVLETIRVNGLKECYIRPVVFRGFGTFGVNPLNNPIRTYIAVWEWGKYLGPEALENGVDVCVSSWNRFAPNTLPAMAKAAANYMNSQLIKMEAIVNGFTEGIALDRQGFIAEGSGENIFLVKGKTVFTPELSSAILPGITRSTVIELIGRMGLTLAREALPRESLYIADEVFFSGTAAEITPIRSVDKISVGEGKRGPVTKKLQDMFFDLFKGKEHAPEGWLTPVYNK